MIVFDASTLVGAAIGADSVPRRAAQHARPHDRFALSANVLRQWVEVLHRPRLSRFIVPALRDQLLDNPDSRGPQERLVEGETPIGIARSYNIRHATISRLAA